MQKTWLFQANPDRFDISGYLATRPTEINWLVTRYESEIAVGDRAFMWLAVGNGTGDNAGIIAEGEIVVAPRPSMSEPGAAPFWTDPTEQDQEAVRALIRLVKIANKREVLKRD